MCKWSRGKVCADSFSWLTMQYCALKTVTKCWGTEAAAGSRERKRVRRSRGGGGGNGIQKVSSAMLGERGKESVSGTNI